MYDSVNIVLSSDHAPQTDFLSEVPLLLDNISEHIFSGGTKAVCGYCGGLKVTVTDTRVKIGDASLCKWYFGDNFQTLTRSDTRQAIEKLSDTLRLPLYHAHVTRIDVAQNFILKHPIEAYLPDLGELTYYHRLPQPSGLYYQNNKRKLVFYDKIKEQKKKSQPIPDQYRGCNVLRYEMRYTSRLRQDLKCEEVTVMDLYDEHFYMKIIDNWANTYHAINKINRMQLDFSKIKTKSDLRIIGLANLVDQSGGELLLYQRINQQFKQGVISSKQAYDLKQAIKVACGHKIAAVRNDLIDELGAAVTYGAQLYR